MTASFILPAPDLLPAHWLLLEILEHLTFTIHILLVNLILGGSIILLWTRAFSRQYLPSTPAGVFTGKIPVLIAFAITFGVAPLLFIQVTYGHLFYTSSLLMARWWILIVPLLLIAYYCAYGQSRAKSNTASLILTLIMTGAFLYIAFIMSNNNTLMLRPASWNKYFFDRHGTHLNLTDPALFPRWLHFLAASIAFGGLGAAVICRFRAKKGEMGSERRAASALKIFAYATLLQIVIGVCFLLALPANILQDYLGGDLLQTVILALGALTGLTAVFLAFKNKVTLTACFAALTVALMVCSRALLRYAYLREFFSYRQLQLKWQITPLILFLIVFIIGLFILYYMLSTIWQIENRRHSI